MSFTASITYCTSSSVMVADAGCGISIEPEDSTAIAQAAQKLASLPKEQLQAMGEHGREYILENNEYDVLSQKFLDVFKMPY